MYLKDQKKITLHIKWKKRTVSSGGLYSNEVHGTLNSAIYPFEVKRKKCNFSSYE